MGSAYITVLGHFFILTISALLSFLHKDIFLFLIIPQIVYITVDFFSTCIDTDTDTTPCTRHTHDSYYSPIVLSETYPIQETHIEDDDDAHSIKEEEAPATKPDVTQVPSIIEIDETSAPEASPDIPPIVTIKQEKDKRTLKRRQTKKA